MRHVIKILLAAAVLGIPATFAAQSPGAGPSMKVYKTPTCGCCGKWVEHMKNAGFTATVVDLPELSAVKARHGIPQSLQSCHTAVVDGYDYVIEGHVPAGDVLALLKQQPKVTGIAVPGMPIGSPGMEQGSRKDPYDVLAFDKATGKTTVFAKH